MFLYMNMCRLHQKLAYYIFLDTSISLADKIQMMHPSNNEEGSEMVNGIIRSTNLCRRRIKHIVKTGNPKMKNTLSKAVTTGIVW